MKKRIGTFLLAVLMMVGIITIIPVNAAAATPQYYWPTDIDGKASYLIKDNDGISLDISKNGLGFEESEASNIYAITGGTVIDRYRFDGSEDFRNNNDTGECSAYTSQNK